MASLLQFLPTCVLPIITAATPVIFGPMEHVSLVGGGGGSDQIFHVHFSDGRVVAMPDPIFQFIATRQQQKFKDNEDGDPGQFPVRDVAVRLKTFPARRQCVWWKCLFLGYPEPFCALCVRGGTSAQLGMPTAGGENYRTQPRSQPLPLPHSYFQQSHATK